MFIFIATTEMSMPSLSIDWLEKHIELGKSKKIFTEAAIAIYSNQEAHQWQMMGSKKSFDCASVTKVAATTSLIAKKVEQGKLGLNLKLDEILKALAEAHKVSLPKGLKKFASFDLENILRHEGPFRDRIDFFKNYSAQKLPKRPQMIKEYLEAVFQEGIEFRPKNSVVYSDVGFMVLGFYLELLAQKRLRQIFLEEIPWSQKGMSYEAKGSVVPTEICPWREQRLEGEVHDEVAALFGGDCGHAGLMTTLSGAVSFLEEWRLSLLGQSKFFKKTTAEKFASAPVRSSNSLGYAFHLGWDSPGKGGSLEPLGWGSQSFGHWGYTGCGAWFDPSINFGIILLANPVYYGRNKGPFQGWRGELFKLRSDLKS